MKITEEDIKHGKAGSLHIFKFIGFLFASQYVIGYILYQPNYNFFLPFYHKAIFFKEFGNDDLFLIFIVVYFISYFLIDYLLTKDKKKYIEIIKLRWKAFLKSFEISGG
tara:strand:- start:339 stop:665 length:327 start_codon:yes stop_codon:yes gene_type:complete